MLSMGSIRMFFPRLNVFSPSAFGGEYLHLSSLKKTLLVLQSMKHTV